MLCYESRNYAVGFQHIVFNTLTPILINLMCITVEFSSLFPVPFGGSFFLFNSLFFGIK